MADITNPVRITYDFGLHGPSTIEEHSEFNLWMDFAASVAPTDWDACLADIAQKSYDAWGAHADDTIFRTSVTLETVKAAHLDLGFRTLHEQVYNPTSKWAGTGTGASLPWQVSFCAGLYTYTPGTFIAHARNRRGRIYLPPMTSAVLDIPTKGTLSDSRVLDTVTWVGALVAALNAIDPVSSPASLCVVGVVSKVRNKVALPTAQFNAITDVAADGVLDSQRRRTHQEIKTRSSAAI